MWASIFDFLDSGLKKTLQFVKWDVENRENRQPSNKRHLEQEEESGVERIIKIRRTDSSYLSQQINPPNLSTAMEEDNCEIITVPDDDDDDDVLPELSSSKIVSSESLRRKGDLKSSSIQMEGLCAGHEVAPLGENGRRLNSIDEPVKVVFDNSLKTRIGVRLRSGMEFQPRASTSANVFSAPRSVALLEKLQRVEKERYSRLLQSCTRLPVASELTKLLSRSENLDIPEISLRPPPKKDVVEIDLTTDSSPSHEDVDRSSKEIVASTMKFKKKIEECEAFNADWPNDVLKLYRSKERESNLADVRLKSAFRQPEAVNLLHNVLEERLRQYMRITTHVVEEGPVPIAAEDETKLPELTPEMEKRINAAFQRIGSPGDVLVEAFSQRITRRDIHTLTGTNWLNDEVINFYMNLLIERGKNDNYPSVYCFNTFFYPKLAQSGHASLKRWTRKIDIFAHEILIIPVHLGVHWCMACVKFPEKRIEYYDSMGGANYACLQHILKYLQEESLDKKKKPFDTSGWTTEIISDNPQQMNGSDCGMFSCMYSEYICRKAKITFSQKNMPYFRRKMAYEILTKRLML